MDRDSLIENRSFCECQQKTKAKIFEPPLYVEEIVATLSMALMALSWNDWRKIGTIFQVGGSRLLSGLDKDF